MVSSCDSVSSIRDLSRFIIELNTCGSDDDDLQAEQTEKGSHGASSIWLVESIFTCLYSLSIPFIYLITTLTEVKDNSYHDHLFSRILKSKCNSWFQFFLKAN